MENKKLEFKTELFTDIYSEVVSLTRLHHEEITLFDGLEFEIDSLKYVQCEKNNALKIFTIRINDELIGYSSYFLFTHSHHQDSKHASQDTLFIKREYRGQGIVRSFLNYCDSQLKNVKAEFVHRGVPLMNDYSKILIESEHTKLETIYVRRL